MLDEHPACPKCGYDLHGIPAVRCPECGFRYDVDAIRAMAAWDEWLRLTVARDILVRATIAAGLAVPFVSDGVGVRGPALSVVLVVTYVLVFWVCVRLTEAYQGLNSLPSLVTLFIGIAVAVIYSLKMVRILVIAAAVFFLITAWLTRLRDWPTLPAVSGTAASGMRPNVDRYSVAATIALMIATAMPVIGLVR